MTRLARPRQLAFPTLSLYLISAALLAIRGYCMTDDQRSSLRKDTRDLFYHGYSNYLAHAFPEDELKPISCGPQTRNRDDPADIGLNDVLGNYSLTLVDSLSTLAILAGDEENERDALRDFQDGVRMLVELYGDGSEGEGKCGSKACGFDLDSKVQVFETNIRGVGGLLSAHLFAVGELPIRGYEALWERQQDGREGVRWTSGYVYDGQLLRLALDLATRLLPAFGTDTGLPYPRVNLRTGVPFYHAPSVEEEGFCRLDGSSSEQRREITETCTAGAGSLVLEFTTLSRLTGDMRFEDLAKRAFFAVWSKRSHTGLLGNGIDAETGQWSMPPLAGIGAGIDSFFEYAFKSYVLLSSLPASDENPEGAESFLNVWTESHAAIRHHIHRKQSTLHPFYGQSDFMTGAPRYTWVDNLSAYYPGLLVLAGEVEEAIESHLLFSALWTRFSALPERWHLPPTSLTPVAAPGGYIDPHFKHWAGRPEFIESTYYLYQATRDPYYLHIGEMALRDIRRRCWAKCGWADLGDVISGEQRDRMESFFLGETAKYLYLLFTEEHPLNKGEGGENVVFTTEGHPLVIPRSARKKSMSQAPKLAKQPTKHHSTSKPRQCPVPPPSLPLSVSNIANRHDLFHAAALTHLHLVTVNPARSSPLMEASQHGPGISFADVRSPSNYTFYPWTLPQDLVPKMGMTSAVWSPITSTLTFPDLSAVNAGADAERTSPAKGGTPAIALGALQKTLDGILIHSLSNIRLSMVQEPKSLLLPSGREGDPMVEMEIGREFRVQGIANWMLGRDEKVMVTGKALERVSPTDPHFTRKRDLEWVDLVVDMPADQNRTQQAAYEEHNIKHVPTVTDSAMVGNKSLEKLWDEIGKIAQSFLKDHGFEITTLGDMREHVPAITPSDPGSKTLSTTSSQPTAVLLSRTLLPAILPTGVGAASLSSELELPDLTSSALGTLPLRRIFFMDSTLCTHQLPPPIAKSYQALVIRRGGCSFNEKLANIPIIQPSTSSEGLQLVIVLDDRDDSDASRAQLIRPLLDTVQRTPSGLERRHPIPMVMVDGRKETRDGLLSIASALGTGFEGGDAKVVDLANRKPLDSIFPETGTGMGVKRRYWFESMGVPIANLIVL